MKTTYGEYIAIEWSGTPEAEYVRGHTSAALARLNIADALRDDISTWKHRRAVHKWACWVPCSTGEFDGVFHPRDEQKRGCFAVTAVFY